MDGKRIAALLVAADVLLVPLIRAVPAAAATASEAPGAPGANATWDESRGHRVRRLARRELEGLVHARQRRTGERVLPGDRHPDTFGLQYIVTNGTSFASTETAGTSHVDLARRSGRAGLAAGQQGDERRLHDHQDLHRRPVPLGRAHPDHVRQHSPPRPCSSTPTTTRSSTTTGWATPAAPTPPAVTWWRPNGSVASALAASTGFSPGQHRLRRHVQRRRDRADVQLQRWAPPIPRCRPAGTSTRSGRSRWRPAGRPRSRWRWPSTPASRRRSPTRPPRSRPGSPRWRPRSSPGWESWLGGLNAAAGLGYRQPGAAGAVRRVADGGEGGRGQDLHGCVRRRADRPWGAR